MVAMGHSRVLSAAIGVVSAFIGDFKAFGPHHSQLAKRADELRLGGDGVAFVEWPAVGVERLGRPALEVRLEHAGEDRRTIEIVGLDRQACGGTHLASTGGSPPIRILKIDNKGRYNRRIRIGLAENP